MPSPTALPALPALRTIPTFVRRHGRGLLIYNCPKIYDIEGCRKRTFAWLSQILQVLVDLSFIASPIFLFTICVITTGTKACLRTFVVSGERRIGCPN